MTISAEKLNPDLFLEVYSLVEENLWLKPSIHPLIELWNLCESSEQRYLIKSLFERFTFITSDNLRSISSSIVHKISEWGFDPIDPKKGKTYISAIADTNEVDGSIAGLNYVKNKFPQNKGWDKTCFIGSIIEASYKVNTNDTLILFDDFIGSGKTLIRKHKYLSEKLKGREVKLKYLKIVSFAGMEFGIKNISHETEVEVYCPVTLKKGLTDYETNDVIEEKKELMRKLEESLSNKFHTLRLKDHSLGYKGSEALFQIQDYNCPNNLFPIFWWPKLRNNNLRKTIFSRTG